MDTYTADEIRDLLPDESIEQVNAWLARGDGIAVYRNKDFDSADLGHVKFASFGSKDAMFVVPPHQLPDFPGEVNWRYQLDGVFRRKIELPVEREQHDYENPFAVAQRIAELFRTSEAHKDRISGFGVEAFDQVEDSTAPWRFDFELGLRFPQVTVTIKQWFDPAKGVDRLGPFEWWLTAGDGRVSSGTDPNLGGTLVAVLNGSRP